MIFTFVLKEYRWWLFLLLLSTIVISDDCYWFANAGINSLITFKYVYIAILPIISFVSLKGTKVGDSINRYVIPCTLLFILSALVSGSSIVGGPMMLTCTFLAAIIITSAFEVDDFSVIYIDVVSLIITYSLVIWLGVTLGIFQASYTENTGGSSVYTFAYCAFYSDHFGFLKRNSAIFREPGVYMVYIVISFLMEAFLLKRKIPIYKLLLYIGGMLSTLSTAGFLILAIAYFVYIYKQRSSFLGCLLPLCLICVVGYLFSSSEELIGDVFGKFERGEDSASVLGRISSILVPLSVILKYPILGTGAEAFRDVYMNVSKSIFGFPIDPQGMATNTILNAGTVYGIWFAIFLIAGLLRFSQLASGNIKLEKYIVFILLCLTFSNESMFYSIILYFIIFYGYKHKSLKI